MSNLPEDEDIWLNRDTMQCEDQKFCWKEFLAVLVVLALAVGLIIVTGWVEKL